MPRTSGLPGLRLNRRPAAQVAGLGPGSLQSWAADVIEVLRAAHKTIEDARARGDPGAAAQDLQGLRRRYDEAVAFGITHNRHRDWPDGNHPGYALATWLRDYAPRVWLFTREASVDWTNNVSEQEPRSGLGRLPHRDFLDSPVPSACLPAPRPPRSPRASGR
jgi:hypothetical protein